ncbi:MULTISPECIES: hypothetical protein [Olleya]|uniref:hypothetical protein n=1 Tax=Olleya TaxID=336276 RepID=UPI000C31CEEC|nr:MULTISPECIES: hypothetical protein [Olleya]PKG53383.1 hypothetical protein CXF54_00760 [Olleya sp. 1-3]
MKNNFIIYIFLFMWLFNCKPIEPFASNKDKRNSISLIKSTLDVNKNQFKKIKQKDSILFLLSKSLNNKVKPSRLIKRLDSFYLNKYTEGELKAMLKLEYIFRKDKNFNFEIDRSKNPKQGIKVDNVDDGKKFMDSLVSKTFGKPNIIIDSTKNN